MILQTKFAQVTGTVMTNSTVLFVDLLSIPISAPFAGTNLHVLATATFSNSASGGINAFQIELDGNHVRGAAMRNGTANDPYSVALSTVIVGLTAGAHTVKLQWKVSTGTVTIRPTVDPKNEHCTLLVYEVVP